MGARGSTVIDYIICNERTHEIVKEFRVGDRVDSDHLPMEVTIEVRRRGRKQDGEEQEEKEEGREEERWKICWDKDAIESYKEKTKSPLWVGRSGRYR